MTKTEVKLLQKEIVMVHVSKKKPFILLVFLHGWALLHVMDRPAMRTFVSCPDSRLMQTDFFFIFVHHFQCFRFVNTSYYLQRIRRGNAKKASEPEEKLRKAVVITAHYSPSYSPQTVGYQK